MFLGATQLTVRFGGLTAVDSVSLSLDQLDRVGVIGPNGAGKTTLFAAICGSVRSAGSVRIGGLDASTWPPHRRAQAGLARTFQQGALFGSWTVRDNLLFAAAAPALGAQPIRLLRRGQFDGSDLVDGVVELLGLGSYLDQSAGRLSGGIARLVEIGRALCVRPKMLLLDEPSSGLDPDETAHLVDRLAVALGEAHCGSLVIEHDMSVVNALCERLYVLDFGRLVAEGPREEVLASPVVRAAYLGDDHGA